MAPFIDIHTHNQYSTEQNVIAINSHRLGIGEITPAAPYSAGIHPWDVPHVDRALCYEQIRQENIVAVGETGLDFLYPERRLQEEVFRKHLEIANERGLPIFIHCVKAFESVMKILTEFSNVNGVIFHGYIGSLQQTLRIMESGYSISVGKPSLGSPKTVDSLKIMPLDRLFIETDDKDIVIEMLYKDVAGILGISLTQLKTNIYTNYLNTFCRK